MPGLDQRGPEGKGARTGRGMGRCNSNRSVNTDNEAQSTISERGNGRGLGLRHGGRRQGRGRAGMND